jgi:hypothetical protein
MRRFIINIPHHSFWPICAYYRDEIKKDGMYRERVGEKRSEHRN